MRVVLLSGGGGGARFARGLADVLEPGELTVVGNVGDDLEILGLHVSPDLDSLLYTLGGLIDGERGWGRSGETWNALESAGSFGGEVWFRLGDRDIGLHLVRTHALRSGARLSEVTAHLSEHVGIATHIVPATDDPLRTHVLTPAGRFAFQEWFVGRRNDVRPNSGVLRELGGHLGQTRARAQRLRPHEVQSEVAVPESEPDLPAEAPR